MPAQQKIKEAAIDRLLQDMLFFCSQAGDPAAGKAPVLQAVRNAFGLQRHQSVDYETNRTLAVLTPPF